MAVGKSTNDFAQPPRHFLSPDFRLFSGKPTFSTGTPVAERKVPQRTLLSGLREALFVCHWQRNYAFGSLQLRLFGFRSDEYGDVSIRVLPKRQKILIRGAGLAVSSCMA
jgi:hypothetical protein